ncbi:MAG TPA: glycosyltransferase family 39 protein [Anaerolineales bacterium]|nr:glycosyltransferase family 39 protein [Anaerolineales bacterium]
MKRTLALANLKFNPLMVLLGLNFIVIGLGFTEFFAPISGDTSIYAYYGRQINHGLILYRDLWDFKSPGIYYLFALLFKLLPDSLTTLRLSAVVANILASFLIYRISIRFFSISIALTGSAIYLLVTNLGGYFNKDGPFPETYIPLLGVIGFYFWIRFLENKNSGLGLFSAGLFAGTQVVLKQSSISLILSYLFCIVWVAPFINRAKARHLLFFFLGVLSAILPWLFYFYFANVWSDFWSSVVLYPRLYAGSTPLRDQTQGMLALISSSMQVHGIMWMLSAMGLVFLITARRILADDASEKIRILLPWIGFGLILIILPGRFYERYLMEILIPAIFLCEYALSRISSVQSFEMRILKVVAACFFILAVVVQQSSRSLHMIDDRLVSHVLTRSESLAKDPLFLRPDVTVFAWGDPRIPYVTEAQSGVKWLNIEPFLTSCSYVTVQVVGDLMSELTTHPPLYFIESPARPLISESCLKDTRVVDFIADNYKNKITVGDAIIYILNTADKQ